MYMYNDVKERKEEGRVKFMHDYAHVLMLVENS